MGGDDTRPKFTSASISRRRSHVAEVGSFDPAGHLGLWILWSTVPLKGQANPYRINWITEIGRAHV